MRRVSMTLSRKSLLMICKSFVRPILDYADIIYDKPRKESVKGKLEAIPCNVCLAITGAIRGTFQESIYRERGLEILNDRRYSRKLFFFIKVSKDFPLHICRKF